MKIDLISSSLFSQFFFASFVSIAAIAVDPRDYVFVDLKKANLKVKDFRALLDRRGLPYHNFHEKSEYINALVESGPLTVGELKIAQSSDTESFSTDVIKILVTDLLATTFEKTVLEGSEIWLVRIDPTSKSMKNTLEEAVWHQLITTLSTFQVEFGQLNCKTVPNYCQLKGWDSPTLILVVPRLYNSAYHAAKAVEYSLEKSRNSLNHWFYEVDSVVRQVYSVLDGKLVRYLQSREDFGNLQTDKLKCFVHIVLLTDLRHCPFLLSALAAKFNYGSHCFAFGPKAIASDDLFLPDNHVGAFYAIKSHYFYTNSWQIIPQNLSTAGAFDDKSNGMVTFESLSNIINRLSPKKAEKLKDTKGGLSKGLTEQPGYITDYVSLWGFFRVLAVLVYASPLWLLMGISIYYKTTDDKRRKEELIRYRLYISRRNRLDRQNFKRDVQKEEETDMSDNGEFLLRRMDDFFTVFSLRLTHPMDWHQKVFARYNFRRAVSKNMRRLLAHYNIRMEEIGFSPYNWILRLPTVETDDLPEEMRLSLCPICQCSIDSPEDSLCRLPCNCKDVIYHFDCVMPWLIKREDPNSHNFISGKLHTERPCPTCRFDVTKWGLRQHLKNN